MLDQGPKHIGERPFDVVVAASLAVVAVVVAGALA